MEYELEGVMEGVWEGDLVSDIVGVGDGVSVGVLVLVGVLVAVLDGVLEGGFDGVGLGVGLAGVDKQSMASQSPSGDVFSVKIGESCVAPPSVTRRMNESPGKILAQWASMDA